MNPKITPNSWTAYIFAIKELTSEPVDYKVAMQAYIGGIKPEEFVENMK